MKKGLYVLAALAILGGITSAGAFLTTANINEVVATGESEASVQNVGKIVQNKHTGEILYCDSANAVTAITTPIGTTSLRAFPLKDTRKGQSHLTALI